MGFAGIPERLGRGRYLIKLNESWLLPYPIFGSHFPVSLSLSGMSNAGIYVLVVLCIKG